MARHILLLLALLAWPAAAAPLEVGGILLKEGPLDVTRVSQEEWAWRGGAESYPAITFQMASGRAVYAIRHDRRYGNGSIGFSEPTRCNWYESGMLTLLLNGKRFDLLPAMGETVQTSVGKKGKVILSWENEVAKVTYTFVLLAKDDKVFLEIALQPKAELTSIEVRLMNYPGGFSRTPRHRFHTPARVLEKPGRTDLDAAKEPWLFLSDDALDPLTHPGADGPSALAFAGAEVTSAAVYVGGYGAPMVLNCRPTARRLRFCFWEFPKATNQQGLERLKASVDAAMALLGAGETFGE